MLTMLLMRPGTAWLMLYCSASRTRSALSNGEPGGYSGTTTPPGKMGNGAYGASFAGPGFGTDKGAGSGASVARGAFWALPAVAASTVHSSAGKADPMVFLGITLRLQLQRSFSGRTAVDQLERLDALRLPSVPEENQARHRQRAVSFGQGGFLHILFHRPPFRERHLGYRSEEHTSE